MLDQYLNFFSDKIEEIPSKEVLVSSTEESSKIFIEHLFDVYGYLKNERKDLYLPGLKFEKESLHVKSEFDDSSIKQWIIETDKSLKPTEFLS